MRGLHDLPARRKLAGTDDVPIGLLQSPKLMAWFHELSVRQMIGKVADERTHSVVPTSVSE